MTVVEQELLRTLHRLHRQKNDLQSRIDRGPRQLKASATRVEAAEKALKSLKDALKKTQLLANEKQLLMKQREDKILAYKGKLNAAKSNEEFQGFKNQIAADEQANEVLSDEIYEQLEKIDEINAQIEEADKVLKVAKEEQSKIQGKIDAEAAQLRSELDRIKTELSTHEEQVPIAIKADYLRVAAAKGEEALAVLEGDFCGNCYQKITTMQHSDLAAKKVVYCKSCGAILYLPENTRF